MVDWLYEQAAKLLRLPGAVPVLAALLLVLGLPRALRSRRPRLYCGIVITPALIALSAWLQPTIPPYSYVPLVAMAILVFGLADAHTFPQPGLFRAGILMIAVGLVSFAALPLFVLSLKIDDHEGFEGLEGIALVLALLVAAGIFFGGLGVIGRAIHIDKQDSAEDDFSDV